MEKALVEKVSKFFTIDYYDAMSRKEYEYEELIADVSTIRIMAIILGEAFAQEAKTGEFYAKISRTELSRKLSGNIKTASITRRLRMLARSWLVTVDSDRWISHNYKDTQVIRPNEAFKYIFAVGKNKDKIEFIHRSLQIKMEREDGEQGFRFAVSYGKPEDETNKLYNIPVGESYHERLDAKKQKDVETRKDNHRWKLLSDSFIQSAGELWAAAQMREGYGEDKPLWAGDLKTMTQAAKRERSELVRAFQTCGGYVTSLCWSIYCSSNPKLDDKNQPKFDRKAPWRQCVFSDKRPSQFAKNLQSLIQSEEFKKKSTSEWESSKPSLASWFGDLVEQEPRDGVTRDKIGYSFGKKIIQQEIIDII